MYSRTRSVLVAGVATIAVAYASSAVAQVKQATANQTVKQATTADYDQRTGRDFQPGEWVYVEPLLTVFRRPRPELDALGITAGSFILQPELQASVAFNDNVFADEAPEIDDTIFYLTPSVRARSQWSRHMVGAEAFANIRRYNEIESEDAEEGGATFFGRVDISEDQNLFGSVTVAHNVEGRADADNDIALPVEVRRVLARAGYSLDFARGNIRFEVEGRDLQYDPASERDRDRQEIQGGVTVSYALTPRITPFVTASYEDRDYDLPVDFSLPTGFNRDSEAFLLAAGARVEISDIMFAELALGGTRTNFGDAAFDDVTTFSARGDLTWNVTTLTSLIGRIERSEEATTQVGVSSKTVTSASLRAEHELLRTLLLYASVRYLEEDFRTARTDEIFGADAGAEWLLNRWLTVFGDYRFADRDSDAVGQDFTNNVFALGARLRY
jgi:hypothetical protein